jgi:hypothetical protein
VGIVALCRIVNQLRFVHAALPSWDDDSPAARRQRLNSFFFTAALLHEGVPLAQRLAQHYRYRTSFAEGFAELLRDSEVRELLSTYVKPLRNQAVFHADESEIAQRLAEFTGDGFVFASGTTFATGQVYYDLADIAAMRTFVGPTDSYAAFLNASEAAVRRTTALTVAFMRAADKLIADVLKHEQFLPGGLPSRQEAL